MNSPMNGLVRLGVASGLAASWAAAAVAQDQQRPVLAIERAAAAEFLPDERDAGLARALEMVPIRLREVLRSGELDLMGVPIEVVDIAALLAERPGFVGVTAGGGAFGVVASAEMDNQDEATDLHAMIGRVLRATQAPTPRASERFERMFVFPTPAAPIAVGPRETDEGWRYEVHAGEVGRPDAARAILPTYTGVGEAVFRATLDLAALSPAIEPFVMLGLGAQPGGAMITKQLRDQGFLGERAMRFEVVLGFTDAQSFYEQRFVRAREHADALGLPTEPLDRSSLRMVPADATAVLATQSEPMDVVERILSQYEQVGMGGQIETFLERIEAEIGVAPIEDFLEPLGATSIAYFADSTGGGAITSLVVLQSLDDPGAIRRTIDRLANEANERARDAIDSELMGVRVGRVVYNDRAYLQVHTPGLPLPLAPTLAVVGDWLVIGATPHAAIAAAQHMAQPGEGLLGDRAFARESLGRLENATQVFYVDSERTMRDGYPLASFGVAALANAVRSVDGEREPGVILGPMLESGAARGIFGTSYWDGDTLIGRWTGDRSWLVTTAAYAGIGDASALVGGYALGVMSGIGIGQSMDDLGGLFPASRGRGGGDWDQWDDDAGDESAPAEDGKRRRRGF